MFRTMVLATGLSLGGAAMAQSNDEPPSPISGLEVSIYSGTAAGLKWRRATDDRGVRGYEVYREGELVGEFDALSYIVSDLVPGALVNFSVISVDTAGQRSADSVGIAFSTPGGPQAVVRPTTPALRAAVYSGTAAGLAWTRPSDPSAAGQRVARYEVRRDGVLVSTTQTLSYIDRTLEGGRTYEYELVAINTLGVRSEPALTTVTTPGGGGGSTPLVAAPAGLRAVVYSSTAGALAWDRAATSGLRYEVLRDGISLGVVDATSYVDDTLSAGRSYDYAVTAIATDGRRSGASTVSLVTEGGRDDAGGEDALLTADNAESILREVVSIANGDFVPQFLSIAGNEAGQMQSIFAGPDFGREGSSSMSNYVLIEGSTDEPPQNGSSFNGGRYTCVGGGSAALIDPFASDGFLGYTVSFDGCVAMSSTLGATVTFNGGAEFVPRLIPDGVKSVSYDGFSVEGDGFRLAIDGFEQDRSNSPDSARYVGEAQRIVSNYSRTTPDGDAISVVDYRAVLSSVYLPPIDRSSGYTRRASADVTFSAVSPTLGDQPLNVTIDLSLDESTDDASVLGPSIGQAIGQWTNGGIQIDAPDGSRIRAEPIPGNPDMLRIQVGDDTFERAWDDGFLVPCYDSLGFGSAGFGCG